jgi:hypothetical protein
MIDWRSFLKADPTEWLLEKDNPSVRRFTLTEILNKPENDPEVKEAKDAIMKIGVVPQILAEQNDEGYWHNPRVLHAQVQGNGVATHNFGGTWSR